MGICHIGTSSYLAQSSYWVRNKNTKRHFKISFPRENEVVEHDLVDFKVQCVKVFCYHGSKSAILLFNSIFGATPEVSSKL